MVHRVFRAKLELFEVHSVFSRIKSGSISCGGQEVPEAVGCLVRPVFMVKSVAECSPGAPCAFCTGVQRLSLWQTRLHLLVTRHMNDQ